MSATALLGVLVRWILFAAVLGTTGAAAFRFLVLRRVPDGEFRAAAELRAAAMATVLATLGVVAVLARLPLQVLELRDATVPLMPQVQQLGFHTMWGAVWSYQLITLIVAAIGFASAQQGGGRGWTAATIASVLAAASPSLAGHAIGSERLTTLAVASDVLHVLAASAWLGGMLFLLGSLALARGVSGVAADVVSRYSSVALASAGLVVLTGGFATWLHVGTLHELWQSRYGLTLCAKLVCVLLMAGAGAWNWRTAGPRLAQSGDVRPMWRSVRFELWWGLAVILATAVLVAVPEPGME